MTNIENIKNKIIEQIKTVYDPEITVNIFELGLIYNISVDEELNVKILMTVTAPNCPVADTLPMEVKNAVEQVSEIKSIWVELTFDPPWTPELMTDAAKIELGLF